MTIDAETPATFHRLLNMHIEAGYSKPDLAKLMLIRESALDELLADASAPTFDDHGVRLRLVRDND